MINKSYPARHRLIYKGEQGTIVEGKPFVSRWGSVLSTLGLSLSGTILFANEILLTEGDSDPMYIHACFQRMISEGKLKAEINGFSALSTSNSRNADVMLRILGESKPTPNIMLLFDGDKGGKEREADLKDFIVELGVPSHRLDDNLSIEDYLPGGDELYAAAVSAYLLKLTKKNELPALASKSIADWRNTEKKNSSLCAWSAEFATKQCSLNSPLSKVGVAREYIGLMDGVSFTQFDKSAVKRCLRLLEKIVSGLQIPEQATAPQKILATPEES